VSKEKKVRKHVYTSFNYQSKKIFQLKVQQGVVKTHSGRHNRAKKVLEVSGPITQKHILPVQPIKTV
jgi:hypothetical protein